MKIALIAKAGSGKNTVCDMFKIHNTKFVEYKFAAKLYEAQYAIQNVLGLPNVKEGPLLQYLGTEYGRKYHGEDFWINQLKKSLNPNDFPIITDCRFKDELKWCKENGFTTIKLYRDIDKRIEFVGNRDQNHKSEIDLDDIPDTEYDYVIDNNGHIDDLAIKVQILYDDLRSKQN
jgi:hypothetical protein